jgi:hypothetical protein
MGIRQFPSSSASTGTVAAPGAQVEKNCRECPPMLPDASNDFFRSETPADSVLTRPAGTRERVRNSNHSVAPSPDSSNATTEPLMARTRRIHAASPGDLGQPWITIAQTQSSSVSISPALPQSASDNS